jgi:hypothetical protein
MTPGEMQEQYNWNQVEPQELFPWTYQQAAINAERQSCSDDEWDRINQFYSLME